MPRRAVRFLLAGYGVGRENQVLSRTLRASAGGYCYHALNRGNERSRVFHDADDCHAFGAFAACGVRPRPDASDSLLCDAQSLPFGDLALRGWRSDYLDALAGNQLRAWLLQALPRERPFMARPLYGGVRPAVGKITMLGSNGVIPPNRAKSARFNVSTCVVPCSCIKANNKASCSCTPMTASVTTKSRQIG